MITKNKTKCVRFRDTCKTHQNMKTLSKVLKTKTFSVYRRKLFCTLSVFTQNNRKFSLICVFGKPKIYKITKFVLREGTLVWVKLVENYNALAW